jgi:hypothetical protein
MMKLTKIARGHIVLEAGNKTTIVYGEAFIRGHESPDLSYIPILFCNGIFHVMTAKFQVSKRMKLSNSFAMNLFAEI